MSPCSARLRYGRDLSLECWDLRANVVFGRASLCARSLRGERSQFADCWCFCGVHACASGSWSLWLSVTSGEHYNQGMSSDCVARESHEWAQASPTVVVSRIAAGGVFHGGQDTFENTLFRLQTPNGMLLVLVYVDDLLVAAESPQEGESFLQQLQTIWRIKLTGRIPALKKGVLQFLGRTIYRERDGESTLNLGVSEAYMTGVIDSWHEKLKPNKTPPKLEEIYKDREKQGEDTPLTAEGEARYRRVLGQLAWAALSRADLCFSVSYLARFQSKPSGAAEACLRALLRWLLTRLHRVQIMPSPEGSPSVGPRSVVGFCDASWNVASVSGGVLMFAGCCIKVFSRKQECPALSSAEAELCAMTENSKELVSLGMLLESILDGIPLTILGTPQCTTGTYQLVLRNDATAAISISSMEGLLRRVRHIELRAKYIQMLVKKKKRLLLEHIPGLQNPSDGLTKSFKTRDMLLLPYHVKTIQCYHLLH